MKMLLLSLTFLSQLTWAHVPAGTYQGKDANGKTCSFWVGDQWFLDNQAHPLNERLPVGKLQLEGVTNVTAVWNLFHPPVVDMAGGKVRFNHDMFHEVLATKTGAESLVLLKGDDETGDAPKGIIYIQDNYRDLTKSVKVECKL